MSCSRPPSASSRSRRSESPSSSPICTASVATRRVWYSVDGSFAARRVRERARARPGTPPHARPGRPVVGHRRAAVTRPRSARPGRPGCRRGRRRRPRAHVPPTTPASIIPYCSRPYWPAISHTSPTVTSRSDTRRVSTYVRPARHASNASAPAPMTNTTRAAPLAGRGTAGMPAASTSASAPATASDCNERDL